MGLVWYTVELIDYGLWIVIVWIVCSRSSCLSFLLSYFGGGGGICVLSCVLYFSDVRAGLVCC